MIFSESDPLRPAAWRWLRAQHLADPEMSLQPTAMDDTAVRTATDFLKKFNALTDYRGSMIDYEEAVIKLREEYPDLWIANEIYSDANFLRWAIEAMVVGGLDAENIAKYTPCKTSVVEEFEKNFFDVRSRLKYPLFVVNELLSPAMAKGTSGKNYDYWWKSLALYHGTAVLAEWWKLAPMPMAMRNTIDNMIASSLRKVAVEAINTRQIDKYSAHDIMTEYLELRKAENESAATADLVAALDPAETILKSLQFSVRTMTNAEPRKIEGRTATIIKELSDQASSDKNIGSDQVIKE